MIRAYGGNDETLPPIVFLETPGTTANLPFGEAYITIEFDVDAPVPPSFYAKFVHCSYDWQEDDNVFLNDITLLRTSNITWESSPIMSRYYTYRGKLQVPNEQVKFPFAGNWKMKLLDLYEDSTVYAEARFFVINPKVDCSLNLYSDFYEPTVNATNSAFNIELIVTTSARLFDSRLNTAVIYRNHRWFEPYYISQDDKGDSENKKLFKYKLSTLVSGFSSAGKIFRINGVPAQNAYRILELDNLAMFPNLNTPVRLPLSDLRRNGIFTESDDDGAMITTGITHNNDNYVNVEFLLDPEGWISRDDVFIAGSFNEWKPDASWQMYYDEKDRYYHLRHWVRRARHNYLYATGRYNYDTRNMENLSYDEFEGNTVTSGDTFIAMIYYREFDYGGYDALVGMAAGNIYSDIRRR